MVRSSTVAAGAGSGRRGRTESVDGTDGAAEHPSGRTYYVEIFLVSLAALLLEISYTRVISFKLFYYYTYLIIGLALMGIGSGGVLVAVSGRLRRARTEAVLAWSTLLGAASVGIGYLVVSYVTLDTFAIWRYGTLGSFKALALMLLLCLALFAPFLAVGVVISSLFARAPTRINRLYFADLVGAGLACAVVVFLIASIGPVATIFLSGLLLAATCLKVAVGGAARLVVPAAVVAVLSAVAVAVPDLVPDQRVETSKRAPRESDVASEWSPIFRVDGFDFEDEILLVHDGLIAASIHAWDGEEGSLVDFGFDTDVRSLPFDTLGAPPGDVAIIGAAGGYEILASLYYEAGQIDALELNPVTYDLVTDRFADYGGNLADRPQVDYRNGDGRSFLARSDDAYDLIWYAAPDSYAAANAATAGAFVLSESYLYTSEAIEESLERLTDDGIVATQFGELSYDEKPNRTTRYVATARHALAELGVDDPSRHILVATATTQLGGNTLSTILVKRTPFTQEEVDRFGGALGDIDESALRWAPGADYVPGPVSEVVSRSDADLDTYLDDYPYDVGAITDDRPFFWHFRPFGDILRTAGEDLDVADLEDTVGERVLLLLLGIAIVLAAVCLLAPFVAIRDTWARLPRKRLSAVYFAALGLGFILYEITLIQRLVLFLGYPTYSLTVTLMSVLLFLGAGSLLSERVRRPERLLPYLVGALLALTAFYLFGLRPMTDALLGLPLALRVPIAFLVLAPLGLCLGMFMPIGLKAVSASSDHAREYVAWGWAVNGFASVIGSVLTTMLAMTFGFQVVLVVALAIYLVAFAVLRLLLRPAGVAVAPATVRR